MQLASDWMARCHALAHCELTWQISWHISIVAHLLVLLPYQVPPRFQTPSLLVKSKCRYSGPSISGQNFADSKPLHLHPADVLTEGIFSRQHTSRRKFRDNLRGVPSAALRAAHSVFVSLVPSGMPTCCRNSCSPHILDHILCLRQLLCKYHFIL